MQSDPLLMSAGALMGFGGAVLAEIQRSTK